MLLKVFVVRHNVRNFTTYNCSNVRINTKNKNFNHYIDVDGNARGSHIMSP